MMATARPTVSFPAALHCHRLTSTKLYCLVTEAWGCKQLAQVPTESWIHITSWIASRTPYTLCYVPWFTLPLFYCCRHWNFINYTADKIWCLHWIKSFTNILVYRYASLLLCLALVPALQ